MHARTKTAARGVGDREEGLRDEKEEIGGRGKNQHRVQDTVMN